MTRFGYGGEAPHRRLSPKPIGIAQAALAALPPGGSQRRPWVAPLGWTCVAPHGRPCVAQLPGGSLFGRQLILVPGGGPRIITLGTPYVVGMNELDRHISGSTAGVSGHSMRDTLFISHANPEDNRFALWLTLRLVREGYKVWCDLTGLLGGEDFWREIEVEIRERTVKFVHVLSRTSNVKHGPRQELRIAKGVLREEPLKDFVLPIRIDDLPHTAVNIELAGINIIDCHPAWAPGLTQLLEKLERDTVPKSSIASPAVVTSWWKSKHSAAEGVFPKSEDHASSWFPIRGLPTHLYLHQPTGAVPPARSFRYPGVLHSSYLVSFCPATDLSDSEGIAIPSGSSVTCATQSLLTDGGFGMDRRLARDVVVKLLKAAWNNMLSHRHLPTYEMADGAICSYFTEGLLGSSSVRFTNLDGKRGRRNLVGYRTRSANEGQTDSARRWWHFGIDARPFVHPQYGYAVGTHVLFSSDGSTIWKSKDRLHQARRILCFDWWNDAWRDRLLAAMSWLAQGSVVKLSLGSAVSLGVDCRPLLFRSPVTYLAPDGSVPGLLSEEDEGDLGDLDDDDEASVEGRQPG